MIEWWCEPERLPYPQRNDDFIYLVARMEYGGQEWWHRRVIHRKWVEQLEFPNVFLTGRADRMRHDLFDAAGVW